MRWLVVLLVWPSLATAEGRVGVHVVGGLEGGTITGAPRPDAVGEAGVTAEVFMPGKHWGVGLALERVARLTESEPIGSEQKLDVMVRWKHRRAHAGIGVGVRTLEIEGEVSRPASTVRGYDLLRLDADVGLARFGRVSLDIRVHWTFGLYKGEVYRERFGDVPHEMRSFTVVSSAYVVGLQTSFGWD